MAEILTESFCERCGTRYTFESAAPTGKRLGKFKVLSKGLKNFVLDDEASLDEALAAARGESDRETTTEQLDAFHKTFKFCMECRQYTCANCWNDLAGRCLTCAPGNGRETLDLTFPTLSVAPAVPEPPQQWPQVDVAAWPTADVKRPPEPATGPSLVSRLEAAAGPLDPPVREEAIAEPAAPEVPVEPSWPTEPLPGADDIEQVAAEDQRDADESSDLDVSDPRLVALASMADRDGDTGDAPVSLAGADFDEVGALGDGSELEADDEGVPESDTDPHILARLASIAAPPDVRSGSRRGAIHRDQPVSPDLINRVRQPAASPADPAVEGDRAAAASVRTSELLRRFRPGQSLDAALDAFESALGDGSDVSGPTAAPPVAGAEPETHDEPTAEADELDADDALAAQAEEPWFEPQPDVAADEPAAREPEMIGLEAPASPRDDRVDVPTWRITSPERPTQVPARPRPVPDKPFPAAASRQPANPPEPQWPRQPTTDSLAFLASRDARGSADAIWAASSRDVLAPPTAGDAPPAGIQSCVSCGLSLSATARFCRRCGTRQGE